MGSYLQNGQISCSNCTKKKKKESVCFVYSYSSDGKLGHINSLSQQLSAGFVSGGFFLGLVWPRVP